MRKTLRRAFGVAMLATALMVPAPAAMAKGGVLNVVKADLASVIKGTDGWVAVTFTADGGDIENIRMTADPKTKGVTITYPSNTGDHSSLMQNDSLMAGEIDYAAFKLETGTDVNGNSVNFTINVTMTVDGKAETAKFEVKAPLAAYTGGQVEQVTDSVGSIAVGEARWVDVAFVGVAPVTLDLAAVVTGDVTIIHPGERASTSLHHDAQLDANETDIVRFYVDATDAVPGTYVLQVNTTYDGGSLAGTVTLDVTP